MVTKSYTVVIATTDGPSHLLRLAHEGEGLQSVVCLNRTTQQAPISPAYESFVSRPTGLIESRFGAGGYRVDLSENITAGSSWQLGDLQQEVLWVTGAVNHDQEVVPVSHIALKLERSELLIQQVRQAGGRIRFLLPEANVDEVESEWMKRNALHPSDFVPLSTFAELENQFAPQAVVVAGDAAEEQSRAGNKNRIWLPLLLLVVVGAIAGGLFGENGDEPLAQTPVSLERVTADKSLSEVASSLPSPQVDQLLLSWRPVYRIQDACDPRSVSQSGWNRSNFQQVPVVEARQLCGIEVMPVAEGKHLLSDQLNWNLTLRVESRNRAHPVVQLDGRSYSGRGDAFRWVVPLPDTLLSGIDLRWEVMLTESGGGEWQQTFGQRIDSEYQW